jgi:signal transduction histidine kinase
MISFLGSIRAKTSLLFFTLFVGIILPVNWIIYRKTKSVLEEASQREMTWEAEKLLGQVKLDPLIVPLSAQYDIQLQFRSEFRDEIIFASPDFPALSPESFLTTYERLDTLEIIHVSRQDESSDGVFMISLSRSNAALLERLEDVMIYLFLLSSISVALSGMLVYLAAGWMLRPIRKISLVAARIQAGESIERVPVPDTRDESRDLAEALNAMLERIEKTIKTQTNFFASATHELKTPLAVMKAELTTASGNDPKFTGLLAEVERLDHIISDFLLISQLKSDSLAVRKKAEPVEEILYRALQKVSYLKVQHRPKIAVLLEPEKDYSAEVDSDKIETVFINLLENAIRYSDPSSLTVKIKVAAGNVVVEVVNPVKNAIQDTELLTQEFKKSKELSAGLGMGLWICDQILQLHKGSLNLSSDHESFTATVVLLKK